MYRDPFETNAEKLRRCVFKGMVMCMLLALFTNDPFNMIWMYVALGHLGAYIWLTIKHPL